MPRIQPLNKDDAPEKSREKLEQVERMMGRVPNVLGTLAHSPSALEAYMNFSAALAGGAFSDAERELISLAISESNGCNYCVAAHSAILGQDAETARRARLGEADDPRMAAALSLAKTLVEKRGWVDDASLGRAREAGLDDGGIVEVIALVAFNTLTNYTNHVAETQIDFPQVPATGTLG